MEQHLVIDILTILALLLGPIIALELQKQLEKRREERNRKLWVFKTLMAYRNTPLSPNFVQCLNLIDIEFNGDNSPEKAVRTAWKVLLDHFTDLGKYNDANTVAPHRKQRKAEPSQQIF